MNSTMNSSLAAGAVGPISRHFNEYNEYKLILPTSMYLVGYACGPMLWGPLSESYGRKGTMVISFAILTIFSIASAVAPNFAALVIFRLLVGVGGSCAISVVGGICADIYHNPKYRGRSMALFMVSLPLPIPPLFPPLPNHLIHRNRQRRPSDLSSAPQYPASYPSSPGPGPFGSAPSSQAPHGRSSTSSTKRTVLLSSSAALSD
jgi:MFS family permease